MDKAAIDEAARLLAEARRSGSRLERLPEGNRPANFAEAYAIELACLSAIGDTLAGWKVSVSRTEGVMMGLLVRSRVFGSGARIPSVLFSMRAIEAEIAFQFEQALPPRAAPYSRDEVAAAAIGRPRWRLSIRASNPSTSPRLSIAPPISWPMAPLSWVPRGATGANSTSPGRPPISRLTAERLSAASAATPVEILLLPRSRWSITCGLRRVLPKA